MTIRAFAFTMLMLGVCAAGLVVTSRSLGQGIPRTDGAPLRPPPLHLEAMAFDPQRGRLVVFGGGAWGPGGPDTASTYRGQTWEWDGSRWFIAADSASGPGARSGHAMAYDPGLRQVLLFGGATLLRGQAALCDTWAFNGRRWTRLDDATCNVHRTVLPSLMYDTRQQRMLLVEGFSAPGGTDTATRALRVFRLTGGAWTITDSAGPIAARTTRAVFDEQRSVLVIPVFGGRDDGVWEWDGQRWRHQQPATGPASRVGYAAAYDPRRRQVVIIGGRSSAPPPTDLRDAWSWDGTRWHAWPDSAAQGPSGRMLASLVSDSRNQRLLYFGGTDLKAPLREFWSVEDRGWRLLEGR